MFLLPLCCVVDFEFISFVARWAVSETDLPSRRLELWENKWPPYCQGCFYMFTPNAATRLVKSISFEPHYISVDDA